MRLLLTVLAVFLAATEAQAQCATKTAILTETYSATVHNGRKQNGRTEAVGWTDLFGGIYSVATFNPTPIPAGKALVSAQLRFWKVSSQGGGLYSVGPYNSNGWGNPAAEAAATIQNGIAASASYQWVTGRWIASYPYGGVDVLNLPQAALEQLRAATDGRWPRFSAGYYPLTQAGNIYIAQEPAQLVVKYCK